MRPRISKRGFVHPSLGLFVGMSVTPHRKSLFLALFIRGDVSNQTKLICLSICPTYLAPMPIQAEAQSGRIVAGAGLLKSTIQFIRLQDALWWTTTNLLCQWTQNTTQALIFWRSRKRRFSEGEGICRKNLKEERKKERKWKNKKKRKRERK